MKNRFKAIIGLLVLVMSMPLIVEGGSKEPKWPNMFHAWPGESQSPRSAPLPETFDVIPPTSDANPSFAKFTGIWQGWACAKHACDIGIIVDKVTSMNARVGYAFASKKSKPEYSVHEGRFTNDEIQVVLPDGRTKIRLRLRDNDTMEYFYHKGKKKQAWGVLTRQL